MKIRLKFYVSILTIALTVFSFAGNNFAKAAVKFGDVPTDDVLASATSNYSGTGLSRNNFAATIFPPTWAEVTGADTNYTPSPMTVGRADVSTSNGSQLWADGVVSSSYKYVRAHWSAGVGMWQLDSAGLGANISFHNAVLSNTASNLVAAEMARLYKSSSATTGAGKRAAAWKPWYGCGSSGSKCETIYNSIYSSSKDIISITRDTSVARGGGLVSRSCYNVAAPSVTWSCYKYDPSVVQGHQGSWYYSPYNGSSSLQPVPLPFYIYWRADRYGNKTEYRHWLTADTGYDTSKWAARSYGTNARSSVNWYSNSQLGTGW